MAPDGLTADHHEWVRDAFGVDPRSYPPGAPPSGAPPTLTLPTLSPLPGVPQFALPPGPRLRYELTPDDVRACDRYLDAHFDAVLSRGASPSAIDGYRPALEGVPADLDEVVNVLMPLTFAGKSSKDGTDQMFRDAVPQVLALARDRFGKIAATKAKAADDAARSAAVDSGKKSGVAQSEALSWIDDFLHGRKLGTDPMGDGTGRTVVFDGKNMLIATVINTTLAAAKAATFQSGDAARAFVTSAAVARAITKILLESMPRNPDGSVPDLSMQLGWMFVPTTDHVTASGKKSQDQPGDQISGVLNLAFHGDADNGWEAGAVGQITFFADASGKPVQTQSGFGGIQVAWVMSFLKGNLQAGPLFQALVGASRAGTSASDKLRWEPTGQVGVGGQVQYAIPGFNGHVLVGVQAGVSGTKAKGADGTVDSTSGFTFVIKF